MAKTSIVVVTDLPKNSIEAARMKRAYREVAAADTDANADVHFAQGKIWFAVDNIGDAFVRACARDFRAALSARGVLRPEGG